MKQLEITRITLLGQSTAGEFRIIKLNPEQFELIKSILANGTEVKVSEPIKSLKELR